MQTVSEIREILARRGLRPKRRLGQNFLHDKNQLRKLLTAGGVGSGDLVLEVGPGTGTLTETLVDAGAEVIACEVDPDMAAIIHERLGDRVTLIEGDCLAGKHGVNENVVRAIAGRPFRLLANLPYSIASPLIVNLLIDHPNCTRLTVTIQKEVAERLTAAPGTKAYGPLSIVVQALGRVEVITVVKPTSFWPPPEVTSAMVSIEPVRPAPVEDPAAFGRFVSGLFSKRRKQLGSIFGRDRSWPEGVTWQMRPEALTVRQALALWRQSR